VFVHHEGEEMEYPLRVIFFIAILIIFIVNLSKRSKAKKILREELKRSAERFEAKADFITYKVRPYPIQREYTYSLDDYGVVKSSKKGIKMRINYDEIDSVNLGSYFVGSFTANMERSYRLEIKSKKKGEIVIASVTTSMGDAEVKNQLIDFSQFLMALYNKLELRFEKIKFTQGTLYQIKQTFYVIFFVGCILFFLADFAYGRLSINRGILGILAIGAAVTAMAMPFILLKKPKVYHPENGEYPYDFGKIMAFKQEKLAQKNS
jgi:hypothetical protein